MPRRVLSTAAAIAVLAAACATSSATTETLPTPLVSATAPAEVTTTTAPSPTTTTPAAPADEGAFPITITTANGPVIIETRPERIVSLSATSTEVLFAVGAGTQVVAVDDQSNYPAEAPVTDLTGFDPNLEAIAGYGADLVILMYDPGEAVTGLEALGIPVILHPAARTLDDAYAQIEQVGAATGHSDEAANLVEAMRVSVSAATSATDAGGATYYHEVSPDYYTATSATFIGSLYGMLGLTNIADEADPDGYGYPQLSAEHVLAEDPSLVFLADTVCCGQTAETVGDRPGWSVLTAIQEGAVTELDDDIASRWGPRVVELVETIAAAVDAQMSR